MSVNEDGSAVMYEDTHPLGYMEGGSHVLYNHV